MEYNIVVVGATGQVGAQVIKELEARAFPVKQLLAFASNDSVAESVEFLGEEIAVQALDSSAFAGADIVFFCAPAQVSKEYLPEASQAGAFCIDLSRHSAAEQGAAPCIVPELASPALLKSLNVVGNPPVAAIQAALLLAALQAEFDLKCVSLTVLQSASLLGGVGVDALRKQSGALLNGRPPKSDTYVAGAPRQLALNITPVTGGGVNYAGADEIHAALQRVLSNPDLDVQVEVIQAPIFFASALSLACHLDGEANEDRLRTLLQEQQGVEYLACTQEDDCGTSIAPERDNVCAGITRLDDRGLLNLWSVIDNLRKGSALNAVQIAELYISE